MNSSNLSTDMLTSLGTDLVGGTVQLIGDSISSSKNNRKAYMYAEKLAHQNYLRQQEFWRMQNEYNLPKNQVERLRAAGLNPNAILSGGNVQNVGSTSTSVPEAQMQFNPIPNMGSNFMSGLQSMANLFLTRSQTLRNEADVEKTASEIELNNSKRVVNEATAALSQTRNIGEGLKNSLLALENTYQSSTLASRVEIVHTQLRTQKQALKSLIEETNQKAFQNSLNPLKRLELENLIKLQALDMVCKRVQIKAQEAGVKLTYQQIYEVAANTMAVRNRSALYRSQKELTEANTALSGSRRIFTDKQAEWYEYSQIMEGVNVSSRVVERVFDIVGNERGRRLSRKYRKLAPRIIY